MTNPMIAFVGFVVTSIIIWFWVYINKVISAAKQDAWQRQTNDIHQSYVGKYTAYLYSNRTLRELETMNWN